MVYAPSSLIDRKFLRQAGGPVVSDNERQILRALRLEPGLSRADLTGRFDLTQQSLHRIVDQLVLRGIVRLGPPRPAAGRGQPSPTLFLVPGFAHCWGLSLNTDDIGIALMDLSGEPLAQELHPLSGRSRAGILDLVAERMQALIEMHALDPANCLGIGFGISGYWVGGTRFNAHLPLRDWSLIELGPMLSARFSCPVWVENNANTAAVAEAMLGWGRSLPTFAHISFNYGLGGGLIQDGELWLGGNRNAGELSGMFDPEEFARRPTLHLLSQHLRDHGIALSSIAELSARFDPDWPGVEEWLALVMPSFNRLLAALWAVFDPQAIVLGGQIPPVLARRMIDGAVLHPAMRYGVPRRAPELLVSGLGLNAPALGAAAYPLRLCML